MRDDSWFCGEHRDRRVFSSIGIESWVSASRMQIPPGTFPEYSFAAAAGHADREPRTDAARRLGSISANAPSVDERPKSVMVRQNRFDRTRDCA
jgi:hypothetical protein